MTKRKRPAKVRLYSSHELDVTGLPAIQRDYARLFVHHLIARQIFDKRLKGCDYIPMDSRIIRQYIPSEHAANILNHLSETGQVARTGYCENRSTGYRLSEELRRSRCLIYPARSTKIADHRKRWLKKCKTKGDLRKWSVHKHLDRWLHRVRIDKQAALQFAAYNREKIVSLMGTMAELPIYADQLVEDRLVVEAAIHRIAQKEWFSTVCPYGRYHSNISSFHRFLRPFLHLEGEHLVEVDVSHCQPLCLSILLHKQRNNILQSEHHSEEKKLFFQQLFSFPLCCGLEDNDDAIQYKKDCETGEMYAKMLNNSKVETRAELKKKMFEEVYFGKRERTALLSAFRRLYPTMHKLIAAVKERDYRQLSWTMQRIESEIVINDACDRLRKDHPTIPILTIHDAILTTPSFADTVHQHLTAAFQRRGVNPLITKKEVRPPALADAHEEAPSAAV